MENYASYQPMTRFDGFRLDALRRVSLAYVMWLLIAGVLVLGAYYPWREDGAGSVLPNLLIFYFIAGLHVVYRLKSGGKANIIAPDVLFITFYTVFHLGYVTLFGLGFLPYAKEVFFFESSIPEALLTVNLGLVGFLIGFEILSGRAGESASLAPLIRPTAAWCAFGTALMIVGLITHLGVLASLGPDYLQRYGYRGIQRLGEFRSQSTSLVMSLSGMLVLIGVVVHVIGSALRFGKLFRSQAILATWIALLIIFMLEGQRGEMLRLAAPILLIRHYFIKRVRIVYLVALGAFALFLFTAISLVRTIVFDPSRMIEEYQYQRASGEVMWMSPFIEMGGSFLTVNITCHEVPTQEPYWKGASYWSALLHVVPFLQGFAGRRGWTRWAPSTWVTETYFGIGRAGRGFTLAAEGYLNFGYAGTVLELLAFGVLIRWLMIRFSRAPSANWALIFLGCFGPSLEAVRNHVNAVSHLFAYVFVLALVLKLLLRDEQGETEELAF